MNVVGIVNAVALGATISQMGKKAKETQQGGSNAHSAVSQVLSLHAASSLAGEVMAELGPLGRMASVANSALPLVGAGLLPASALVKSDYYIPAVEWYRKLTARYFPLGENVFPSELGETSKRVFNYVAEHADDIIFGGTIVTMAALPFVGLTHLALGAAAPLAFHALEAEGYIPTSVSKKVERFMPGFVRAASLVGGGPIMQAITLTTMAANIPAINQFVQRRADSVLQDFIEGGGSLEDVEKPWDPIHLSFGEIIALLNDSDDSNYVVNAPHCSKPLQFPQPLPTCFQFEKFLTIFESINWESKFDLLINPFFDDTRFLYMLKKEYPNETVDGLKAGRYIYIREIARRHKKSPQKFLADQLTHQMKELVLVLTKKKIPTGQVSDLEEAIPYSAQILAYLQRKPSQDQWEQVEVEDILIKLAIEGGEYCARGIKRAAKEIADALLPDLGEIDPVSRFELELKQSLMRTRFSILSGFYLKLVECSTRLLREGPSVIITDEQTTDRASVEAAEDVHTMDLIRLALSLGFCPLTESEMNSIGLMDYFTWTIYVQIRKDMQQCYQNQIPEIFKERKNSAFTEYFRKKIGSLEHLTAEQKDMIMEIFTEMNDGAWTKDETYERFYRLIAVMLGVLTPKVSSWLTAPSTDWDEIEDAVTSKAEAEESDEFPDWHEI